VQPTAGDLLSDLISRVRSFGLPEGLEKSLLTKLRVAQRNGQNGLTSPACNELDAFINEVQALMSAGALASAEAAQLIDGARLVQAAMPCT
jgi:hypothetical protein